MTAKGFTLIETLVVLVIIGVALATVGLGMGAADERAQEREVERIHHLLETIADRAQVTGRPHALELQAGGYRVVLADADGGWVTDNRAEFRERLLPSGLRWDALVLDEVAQPLPGRLVFATRAPRFILRLVASGRRIELRGQRFGRVLKTTGTESESGG